MPDGQFQLIIGLDDREARTGNLAFVTERTENSARQGGLPDPQRPGKRDDVARAQGRRDSSPKVLGRLLVSEDHFVPRGMDRITDVPFPFFESSSTVPP